MKIVCGMTNLVQTIMNASKYSEETILQAIEMLKSHKYTGAYIDNYFGFPSDYANMIRRGERWTCLTKDIDFSN